MDATRQPKQARAIRTRERILDQAERAFASKGFEAASLTSDILDPAGISVGSFYHQFTDKRAVLHALLDERRTWRDVVAEVEDAAAEASTRSDAIRAAMVALLDAIDRHPEPWWIHFRELHSADADIRRLIADSWGVWHHAVAQLLCEHGDGPTDAGRVAFATRGLAGVLHGYLTGGPGARRTMRATQLDGIVAGCVGALG